MKINEELMGKTPEGQNVQLFTLTNAAGLRVKVMTYGATLVSVEAPDRIGRSENITLSLDSLADYLKGHPCLGTICGRFANRIARGKFSIGGRQYTLAINNGPNHLHGGIQGFDKVAWKGKPLQRADAVGVELSYLSRDGEEGYPGNLAVTVTYNLNDRNKLTMKYAATTDQPTVLNLTNHAYWNLAGAGSGDVLQQDLTINADRYLPVDEGKIPLGELKLVEGSPLDFRQPRTIGSRIAETSDGYDHCFVLNKKQGDREPTLAARAADRMSGRVMEIYTTEPAVQLYTGNGLDGSLNSHGKPHNKFCGFCLESQHYPDSPNQPQFPSTLLKPGEKYEQQTVHRFLVER